MEIKITVDLSPETKAFLSEFLSTLKSGIETEIPTLERQKEGKKKASSEKTEAKETTAPGPWTDPEPKEISIQEIREKVQSLIADGKRDEIKSLLSDFGVANISTLKKSDYNNFYNDLNRI
jgi:hypothetical protein